MGPLSTAQATGELLTRILSETPAYRRQWATAGKRLRSHSPAPAAVSRVIAHYLWNAGEFPDTDIDLPRKLRDRIRRALSGSALTGQTLEWFIGAFEMTEDHAQKLWSVYSGEEASSRQSISDIVPVQRPMARPQWHRTMTLFERYTFAADGSYRLRHTLQVIQALEDHVDFYLFNHEPYADRIQVMHGGAVGRHHDYGFGLSSDEITLGRPLLTGQRMTLEYKTHFTPGTHFPREVRRAVRARAENLDFAIQFPRRRRPPAIWFCAWPDHLEGEPVHEEPLDIVDGAAHRFLPFAQHCVLGFRWEWAPARF
ncbi:hypothetical protein [Nocardia salmonicida]|uniref:hypothetical protein n=1 Tax=Nocardia salmonicida TaxID=53431 RepID=UPI0007A3D8EA|nr:hypothetical protein [Nocardia salmonicida]